MGEHPASPNGPVTATVTAKVPENLPVPENMFATIGGATTRLRTAARRFSRRALAPRLRDEAWRGQALSLAAALGLMVFMVRVLAAGWPKRFAIFFPDSFSFIHAAKLTPFSPAFYAAERPIAFPTVLFLLGRSTLVTVVVQTFLYGLVYLLAATTVFTVLRQRETRIMIALLVLSIGIEPRFALWTTHILSESLGMTLAVASVLAWWWFSAQPGRRRLHLAGIATIAWLTVRDSNVPPWLAVGVPALLIASFWWRSADRDLRRAMRIWGVVTLVVCVGVTLTQSANGRNRYATINNVGSRVLPDHEITKWFADQGMPVDDALLERTGSNSFNDNWDMLTSPDLTTFRSWAGSSGQRVMLESYARFAPHWINQLYGDLPILLRADQSSYDAFTVAKRLPDAAPAQINGPTTRKGLLIWTVLAVAGLVLAAKRGRGAQASVLGLLLASTFVDLYMAYVGDSVEVQRHMVGPLSRMALVMVLCLGVGADSLVESIRVRRVASRDIDAEHVEFVDVVEPDLDEVHG
ncbi:MAG: hypothetical protein JWN62_4135 [Acidimicrobiales bacterium]|nr:hypothetical protein [Acidimicrobiales bacterium]